MNGCRSLDDIREGKFDVKLSSAQRIGLEFYDGTWLVFLTENSWRSLSER